MFSHVEPFAGDPILSLNEDFQKDPRAHKINLSIGQFWVKYVSGWMSSPVRFRTW